jgi:hypothetical protein
MSDSIYRGYGLHKGATKELVSKLTKRFRDDVPNRGTREGVFLGIDFLTELVKDLTDGHYDGIVVNFGVKGTGTTRTFELVARQLELNGRADPNPEATARAGKRYASTPIPNTNPPDIGSPPITGGGS